MIPKVKKPSLFLFMTEGMRGVWDRIRSWSFRRNHKKLPKGDGHPVLVIPGLLSNDLVTKPLRTVLEHLNYKVYGWGLGINLANFDEVEILNKTLHTIYKTHGEKVSIIGWSLGGLYMRKICADNLDKVRQMITLGTPFRSLDAQGAALTTLKILYRSNEIPIPLEHKHWVDKLKDPLPIQTTCLYSKKDGIVPWTLCKESIEDEMHRNIEIVSSHTGMVSNIQAIKQILKCLKYY